MLMNADSANPAPPHVESLPLVVESVVKRFGAVTAVAGISFEIAAGGCFGLLGPNGAGKSTLIRSIVGRVRLDLGSIRIFGEPVGSTAARADLGWVPQELAVYPLLTCRENLYAFGRYQGLSGKALDDAIAWCLEWAALADRAKSPAKTLSGGMKRRLNMAAGLIHRPRLVLLDEPTVGVDPQSRNRIFEMVEALRTGGTTIIYTTHYMEEAERLCDSIAIIDHGQIIAQGTKEALVARAFGSRISVTMHFGATRVDLEAWAAARGGTAQGGTGQNGTSQGGTGQGGVVLCSVEKPAEIADLLDAASRDGLEILDVTMQRPNLESVFLALTGKDLRS
jgi:ABC-2 type transport system ATP-binding protein